MERETEAYTTVSSPTWMFCEKFVLATRCLGHQSTTGTTRFHFLRDVHLKVQSVAGIGSFIGSWGGKHASTHGHLLCVSCHWHGSPKGTHSRSSHLSCLQNMPQGQQFALFGAKLLSKSSVLLSR